MAGCCFIVGHVMVISSDVTTVDVYPLHGSATVTMIVAICLMSHTTTSSVVIHVSDFDLFAHQLYLAATKEFNCSMADLLNIT